MALLARINELSDRIAALEKQERVIDATASTANTLVRRGASSEITVGDVTASAVSGTLGTFTSGVALPRSSGTALYAQDVSSTGSSITIGVGSTATPLGSGVALRGILSVWSNGDGVGALYFADSGGCSIISDRAGIFAAADTANKICAYVTGGALTIKNNRAGSVTVNVVCWRVA